ncbi:MAG: dihydropteroate synthase [Candidatus Marinimicrobia bacterium]|nr:dihydropteroate synthase [Candidatus Neomarinimicrobiota bacterium]
MYNLSSNIKIMGVLNLTPDSFYSENNLSVEERLSNLSNADIIDVGAESSRPGAVPITSENEIKRIEELLPFLSQNLIELSIDTYKPATASFALKNGFTYVNDITGGQSTEMLEIVANHNANIILMHMQGTPTTMQNNPIYSNVLDDISAFFENSCECAIKAGISSKNIIIDPGIGFGKTISDNDEIINNISKLKSLGFPVLIGVSRKSFLQHNGDSPSERLPTTISANTISMLNGADIIRVHDVDEHVKTRAILSRMCRQ